MTSFVETPDGTKLFYRDCGAGPAVLFLASAAMHSDMWQYQMAALADHGVRSIAYDRRGHGRSTDSGRGFDYDTLADDLAALIEHLDLSGLTLVGHSMGGAEVVRYLSRHGSARVARVALVSAVVPFLRRTADNPDGIDSILFEEMRSSWKRDLPQWAAENVRPFVTPDTSEEMRQWLLRMWLETPLDVLLATNRSIVETDLRAEMRQIAVPTLLVHGDADMSAPLALTGEVSARLIPGSTLRVYEGGPHGLFITHREQLDQDLVSFIGAGAKGGGQAAGACPG